MIFTIENFERTLNSFVQIISIFSITVFFQLTFNPLTSGVEACDS